MRGMEWEYGKERVEKEDSGMREKCVGKGEGGSTNRLWEIIYNSVNCIGWIIIMMKAYDEYSFPVFWICLCWLKNFSFSIHKQIWILFCSIRWTADRSFWLHKWSQFDRYSILGLHHLHLQGSLSKWCHLFFCSYHSKGKCII